MRDCKHRQRGTLAGSDGGYCPSATRGGKTYRPTLLRLLALLVTLALVGCSKGPYRVAAEYVSNLKFHRYRKCYELLAQSDQIGYRRFLDALPLVGDAGREWTEVLIDQSLYALQEVKRLPQGRALATLRVTAPDLWRLERTLRLETLASEKAVEEQARRLVTTHRAPAAVYTDQMVLVRQGGRWRIVADFTRRNELEEEHKRALALYHMHKLAAAEAKYASLLARLARAPFTGSGAVAQELRNERNRIAEALASDPKVGDYSKYVRLENVGRHMAVSREPALFGTLVNVGSRRLDEVQLKVEYLASADDGEKVIFEEEHVVFSTPLSFDGFHLPPPLGPGERRPFGFTLRGPDDVQRRAIVRTTVSGLVFTTTSVDEIRPMKKSTRP